MVTFGIGSPILVLSKELIIPSSFKSLKRMSPGEASAPSANCDG